MENKKMHYIKSESKLIIFIDGRPSTVLNSDKKYDILSGMLKSNANVDQIKEMIDKRLEFRKKISILGLEVNDNMEVFLGDKKIPKDITEVIISFYNLYKDGTVPQDTLFVSIQLFVLNLLKNPDYNNLQDLYSFIQKGGLPITDDGHFLAYKVVQENFKDKHTSMFDNTPGKVVSMPREECNTNRHNTCSTGLHFCSKDYIGSFISSNDKIVEVKVNPKDVTSIPSDYNQSKGRCCSYFVTKVINSGDLDNKKVVLSEKQHIKDTNVTITSKVCSRCKLNKPLSNFSKDSSKKLGVRSECKACK